ncbi:hypothetical protein Nepgr_031670 [Nepenthes gracilis]|uniref:Bifunctional inhibitor/plant lipid transfer protein/seed storage helical domain-containing protein n=1 Tax=Nepenthes gracilis TaxID=150966 RepID=A0AAD3THZ7_NEPGR|nr:hypothetical protein Nepgr_031670 [Nepenthes gracilis]
MGGVAKLIASTALLMAAVMVWSSSTARAQSDQTTCASNLVLCAQYLNDTNPPSTCCSALATVISKQKECLCNIYNDTSLLKAYHINLTQALLLPMHCNITTSQTNICASAPTPSSSTSPTPPGKNAAGRIACTGVSGLLLFWAAALLFY